MLRVKSLAVMFALVALVGFAFVVRAADEPKAAKEKDKVARVNKPWSDLSLTEDQKTKISDIHQKVLTQIKEIHAKEEADINALLTDDQKAQLKKMQDQEKADAKAKKTADAGKEKEAGQ